MSSISKNLAIDPHDRRFLRPTPILDFEHPRVQALVAAHDWMGLPVFDRIGSIYHFVRDEIPFGYNATDDVPASRVLADGYGHCTRRPPC